MGHKLELKLPPSCLPSSSSSPPSSSSQSPFASPKRLNEETPSVCVDHINGELSRYDLEKVVNTHLGVISKSAIREVANRPYPCPHPTVTSGMGEYFIRTVQGLNYLSETLLHSPYITQAIEEGLAQSQTKSRCRDMSVLAAMDMEIQKLERIQRMTANFCRDIQDVWQAPTIIDRPKETHPLPAAVVNYLQWAVRSNFDDDWTEMLTEETGDEMPKIVEWKTKSKPKDSPKPIETPKRIDTPKPKDIPTPRETPMPSETPKPRAVPKPRATPRPKDKGKGKEKEKRWRDEVQIIHNPRGRKRAHVEIDDD